MAALIGAGKTSVGCWKGTALPNSLLDKDNWMATTAVKVSTIALKV